MNSEKAPTLSEYLLNQANKWQVYPLLPQRRTKANLALQKEMDNLLREIVEWRRTFLPTKSLEADPPNAPLLWNHVYCREFLEKVPEMVERTLALKKLPYSMSTDAEWWAYLRESANCLIYGLSLAAIALARAAMESRLREVYTRFHKIYNEEERRQPDLDIVIDRLYAQQALSPDSRDDAHKVRKAANKVLHEHPRTDEALEVFNAARLVIFRMAGG